MARFQYAHRAALDVAVAREGEASRTFAIARRACEAGAAALECLAIADTTVRAQMRGRWSRDVPSPTTAPVLRAAFLAAGDGALAVVAARRAAAVARTASLTARVAEARDELAGRIRDREALERHRGRVREAHELAVARADEAACDEAATIAYGARVRGEGSVA